MAWHRQRSPEDVPTPVAVALSDFCRRAGATTTPLEIREALSVLSEAEDFRVRLLTDNEPAATPLGPFAVIDMVRGTTPQLASTREQCGYYALVQEMLADKKAPPPPPPALPPIRHAPATLAAPRAQTHPALRLAERIAPKKRVPVASLGVSAEVPPSRPPRGRFSQVSSPQKSVRELFMADARPILEEQLEKFGNRFAAHEGIAALYSGRGNAALSMDVFEDAIRRHGLWDNVIRKERERLQALFVEHEGAEGRVAWAMGVGLPALRQMVKTAGLESHVQGIREEAIQRVLGEKRLSQKLDMAGRTRYLTDLGIQDKLLNLLKINLTEAFDEVFNASKPWHEWVETVSTRHGLRSELLSRALDRLGLTDTFRRRLAQ